MSTATQVQVTVNAHQSHWYDIFNMVLQAVQAGNNVTATITPAPIEAGIQIGLVLAPIVAGIVESTQAQNP